jgi:hypothetical protein
MKKIHVNQLGYYPSAQKKAVVPQEIEKFEVVKNGAVVFSGATGEEIYDCSSEETVRIADFSQVTDSGTYFIRAGAEESFLPAMIMLAVIAFSCFVGFIFVYHRFKLHNVQRNSE